MLLAAALVVALAGLGIGLAVAFSGGGSSTTRVPARGSLAAALPGAADVHLLYRGIAQRGQVLGRASAPVTMVEYVDLQCPYCRDFEAAVLPELVTRYVRTGKLKVETRLLAFIGLDSVRGREAALAAGEQNRLFDFVALLYFNQGTENTGWLDDDLVTRAAASIPGLDVPELLRARAGGAVAERAQALDAQASAEGVSSTPTILVGRSGGALRRVALASATDEASVAAAIERGLSS